MKIDAVIVNLNKGGRREHDEEIRGKLLCSIEALTYLLGEPHGPAADNTKVSAEWYLVTDHGNVTVHDYWSNAENELTIQAAEDQAARDAVKYFRQSGLRAYMLTGEL